MTSLRVVPTPADQQKLLQQARALSLIATEIQQRQQLIAQERRRVLTELTETGMRPAEIARALDLNLCQVIRITTTTRKD